MATDYKNTLNLPRTDFPMKADLVSREPERLKKWEAARLYEKIQRQRAGAEKFVLHDGPPFANGDVHIGTALNKILKDIIVKYKTLRGFSAPYAPGWDCHGLPIEFKVSQEMRKAVAATPPSQKVDATPSPLGTAGDEGVTATTTIRKACDAYARKFIDIQRTQFKRLGVLGDWENPYLTLNKEYEADELRLFADIVAKGFVYRGKKPVYWSIPCRTALAEAEVEYADHVSQSVFVKFPVVGRQKTFIVIWTTTPWTLPANLAVAYNKDFQYVSVKVVAQASRLCVSEKENPAPGVETHRRDACATTGEENFIVFRSLLPTVAAKCGWANYTETPFPTEQLATLQYQHPFCHRTGKAFAADFVTSDTGTGFVHIAPGHGQDDYNLGRANGLPIYSPVDDDGKFAYTNDLPVEQQMPAEMVGKSILEKHGKSDANEAVLHELRARHALLHQENYHHSYPHCWRSKTPIIFRAMDQWFIKIDHVAADVRRLKSNAECGVRSAESSQSLVTSAATFRQEALVEIDRVNWIPDWGINRIKGAVQSRPDWCISRQRTWGVPLPAFYDAKGEAILHKDVICKVADLIEQHGSNVWFEKSAAELWALVKPKDWKGPEAVAKSNDTLDVWIDSGSSSRSVLMRRPELFHSALRTPHSALGWQADMYLEGSDQHRGWFQSSLLLSLAGNGAAPFKTVLTHGFMVDADREKISKSKQGAYEKPQTAEAYVKKYGADVLRLWVASQDYRSDIVVSEERINKVGETYRAIRNALRYQLSNLYDFDPAKDKVDDDKLTGLDRWILDEFSKLEAEVIAAYDQYEFHVVYQKLSQFIAVELSSVYHDVIKDRLYTDAANSRRRRSTQTALHGLVTGLCQMLAPILAFTADEAWEFVPRKNADSVHESEFKPTNFALPENEKLLWHEYFELRKYAKPTLEIARQNKNIGKDLDAGLIFNFPYEALTTSASVAKLNPAFIVSTELGTDNFHHNTMKQIVESPEDFREIMNVSRLDFASDKNAEFVVAVHSNGRKCERCWHWEMDIGAEFHADHPTICGRCVEAVMQFKS